MTNTISDEDRKGGQPDVGEEERNYQANKRKQMKTENNYSK